MGRPFRLLPWQKQLILDLFELVEDETLGRMRRRYRTALIGVPKKQGKTELAAALACYFLLGSGEPSPGIAIAAAADYQADLVFRSAATMIELSPTLRGVAEIFRDEIVVPGVPNARIRRVAAAGGKLDGMRLMVSIFDELHEWLSPNQRKVFGMLRGALALADEPLNLMITTAGEDDGEIDEDAVAPWLRMYRYGRLVESGEIDDPAFFFRWWMAPPGCDHRDMNNVRACNPSFGVTVQEAFYIDELGKRTESEFRRYYLNQPVESVNLWLEHGTWESCQVPPFELDPSLPTWLGWDASTKRDSTAVVLVQPREGRLYVKARAWERPFRDGVPVPEWRVPRSEVLDYVRECYRNHNIIAGAYDPHAIAWVAEDLEHEGLPLYEWPQTDQRMCPATQALYEAVIDRRMAHDGDPVLARHIKAAKVKQTPRGGQRLVKSDTGRKIDAAIALVMAIGVMDAHKGQPAEVSIYIPEGDDDEVV